MRILDLKTPAGLITRKSVRLEEAEQIVAPILEDVRKRGDAALLEYARKFDGFGQYRADGRPGSAHTAAADARSTTAAENIRELRAELQLPEEDNATMPDGRRLGQIVRLLDSMGAYIPAGRYPLPSTSADDGDSGASCRRRDDMRRVSESVARNSRHCAMAWRDAHLSDGRRSGHRGPGLWN